nr:MAG TPA: hypothetical protein [Caudoviricetes sp.]
MTNYLMSNDFTVFFYIILDFITVISYNYHTFYYEEGPAQREESWIILY